jgi:hypothetical protein
MSNEQTNVNPETGTKYSRAELHAAFSAVQDPANWKNPIDAVIDASAQDVTLEAVVFFAGCLPTFKKRGDGRLNVKAVGYYVAVGA